MDLYILEGSPACKPVRWTAEILGVPLNLKLLDVFKGEQLSPEFKKLNPGHAVPTLVDNGFTLGESGAIMKYLVNKVKPGHSLYPADPKTQGLIDWIMYFNAGTLYPHLKESLYPHIFFGKDQVDSEADKKFQEKLEVLESFLGTQKYFCGDSLTLADLSVLGSINFTQMIVYDLSKYQKLLDWVGRLKAQLPDYALINDEGDRLLAKQVLAINPNYSKYDHLWN